MATVTKWSCSGCGKRAIKMRTKNGRRWYIVHTSDCTVQPNLTEDVGPVTSVNDPDNAYFVKDD